RKHGATLPVRLLSVRPGLATRAVRRRRVPGRDQRGPGAGRREVRGARRWASAARRRGSGCASVQEGHRGRGHVGGGGGGQGHHAMASLELPRDEVRLAVVRRRGGVDTRWRGDHHAHWRLEGPEGGDSEGGRLLRVSRRHDLHLERHQVHQQALQLPL
ncbi:unnamed protein product, partial [Prorocentrum cordatum]